MRKIVQITSCGVVNHYSTQCDMLLHALCDDGSLWVVSNAGEGWQRVAEIPKGEEATAP